MHLTLQNPSVARGLLMAATAGIALCAAPAEAAPGIASVQGLLEHKETLVITGHDFGAKPAAAPLVWDDASGHDFSAQWDGAWPSESGQYNTGYHAPARNIAPPHSHSSQYIAGAHAGSSGPYNGYDVLMYKNLALPLSYPAYLYASWYQRMDNAWEFGGDNNFKVFDYSTCCEPYARNNWYLAYGPPNPSSPHSETQWVINDDGDSLRNPDVNHHNFWWARGVNPMSGAWSKVEVAIKLTDRNDGYVRVVENASHVVLDYHGPTDRYPGKRRTVAVGGYARSYGHSSNWRYYTDVYIDTTLARVVLANAPTLSRATIAEIQPPVSWSDGLINVTVNLGRLETSPNVYLYVFDANGDSNPEGFPLDATRRARGPDTRATRMPGEPAGETRTPGEVTRENRMLGEPARENRMPAEPAPESRGPREAERSGHLQPPN